MSKQLQRLLRVVLTIFSAVVVFSGNAYAKKGLFLIGSDGDVVVFPYYVKYISARMAEKHRSKVSYPSSVLEHLKRAIEVLPAAARDVNGQAEDEHELNGKTIYVNSKVQKELKQAGVLPGDSPRECAMLFQLLDAANEYKLTALGNAFARRIANRIAHATYDQLSELKKNRYWKHQSEEDRLHQAVKNELIALEESLRWQQEFSDIECTKNQDWIEKYILLFLQGIDKEVTFADYMGLHGQSNWKDGRIELPNAGLTSLEGLERITKPNRITHINVSYNNLMIIPIMKKREQVCFAFSRLTRLTSLDLSNNKIADLPENIFVKNPLQALYLDHNQLEKLPERMCQGLIHLNEISLKENPMSVRELAKIGRLLPIEVVQVSEKSVGKSKKKSRTR